MTLEGQNASMDKSHQTAIQAKLFDFALMELVRNHRDSFQPLWSIDSWVKFLIWLNLNCGLTGERDSLELFAGSLGVQITKRMRKVFFERTLENLSIYLMADPAESNLLLMSVSGQTDVKLSDAWKAIESVELIPKIISDQSSWEFHEGIITIPWKSSETNS